MGQYSLQSCQQSTYPIRSYQNLVSQDSGIQRMSTGSLSFFLTPIARSARRYFFSPYTPLGSLFTSYFGKNQKSKITYPRWPPLFWQSRPNYNQLQKYLRYCTSIGPQRSVRDHVLAIPSPPYQCC